MNLAEVDLPEPRARIQRSISCFSLPEFMLVDGGQGEQVLRQVTPMRRLTNQSSTVTRLDLFARQNGVENYNVTELTTPKPGTSKSFRNGNAIEEMSTSLTEKSPLLQTSNDVKCETACSFTKNSTSFEGGKTI